MGRGERGDERRGEVTFLFDSSLQNTVGDTMMMRNGYLMIFRDNTEKLKELTKEEKDAIKKETNKRKTAQNQNTSSSSSYSFWNRKERALKIQSEG